MIVTLINSISWSVILSIVFLILIAFFIHSLWRISRDTSNKYHWLDMISDDNGRASLTRTLQFMAGITATWIVIKMTIVSTIKIEYFIAYLAAMGISEAFTKFVQAYFGKRDE